MVMTYMYSNWWKSFKHLWEVVWAQVIDDHGLNLNNRDIVHDKDYPELGILTLDGGRGKSFGLFRDVRTFGKYRYMRNG
jgi:hypothetical protein